MNYSITAFTNDIKDVQSEQGSRDSYARHEERSDRSGLGTAEEHFISERDSLFMATYGQNGFPYIQHRGGPKGFLQVLDDQTLAFLDFTGNKQYISVGNLKAHDKVSLIMVDYAARARLKLYARAEVLALDDDPSLTQRLLDTTYKSRPERIILLHVEAFDWNCPQHIPQLFHADEVQALIAKKDEQITELEARIA